MVVAVYNYRLVCVLLPCFCMYLWYFNAPRTSILFSITWSDCLADASRIAFLSTHDVQFIVGLSLRFLMAAFSYVREIIARCIIPLLFVCCYAGNLLRFPSSLLYLQRVGNDYSLAQSFGAGLLCPSNSSGWVRAFLTSWLVQRLRAKKNVDSSSPRGLDLKSALSCSRRAFGL